MDDSFTHAFSKIQILDTNYILFSLYMLSIVGHRWAEAADFQVWGVVPRAGRLSSSGLAQTWRTIHTRVHTCGQFGAASWPYLHFFGLRQETGEPKGNPHRHGENVIKLQLTSRFKPKTFLLFYVKKLENIGCAKYKYNAFLSSRTLAQGMSNKHLL